MGLPGVRVGPLDPDAGEQFGQVSGRTSARQLIRHHAALFPPKLRAALSRTRHDARSEAGVIDLDEVERAAVAQIEEAGETVPDGFKVVGATVRGEDDAPELQVVTYVFRVKSGRTGKGVIEEPRRALRKSFKRGDESAAIADAKKRGVLIPTNSLEPGVLGRIGRSERHDDPDPGEERARAAGVEQLAEERERLQTENEALRAALAAAQAGGPETAGDGDGPDGDGGDEPPAEPWEGYEGTNAQDVRARLREAPAEEQRDLAERVAAYEERNANRSSVLAETNSILDRPAA